MDFISQLIQDILSKQNGFVNWNNNASDFADMFGQIGKEDWYPGKWIINNAANFKVGTPEKANEIFGGLWNDVKGIFK